MDHLQKGLTLTPQDLIHCMAILEVYNLPRLQCYLLLGFDNKQSCKTFWLNSA